MRRLLHTAAVAAVLALPSALPAGADPIRVAGTLPVDEAVARLTEAVTAAGARVFLTVDFAAGNASVGAGIRPTTLVLFGSPKIGATALQEAQTMALFVPLRILAYEDAEGATWLIYSDPAEAAAEHGLDPAHPAVARMRGALARMAAAAAGG